jgi:hypothetical protein
MGRSREAIKKLHARALCGFKVAFNRLESHRAPSESVVERRPRAERPAPGPQCGYPLRAASSAVSS